MTSYRTLLGMLLVCTLAASEEGLNRALHSSKSVETDQRAFPVNELPPLTYSSKKYTVHKDLVTFFVAWQRCRMDGKRLATVENYQDHKVFRAAILPEASYDVAFWIAGTNLGAKPNERQKFYWITNDRPVGYLNGFENWLDGTAPDTESVCIAAYLGISGWIYGTCDTPAFYVCEESQDV